MQLSLTRLTSDIPSYREALWRLLLIRNYLYVSIRAVNGVGMRGAATFSDGFVYDVSTSLNGAKVEVLLLPNPSQGPARLGLFSPGREGLPYEIEILAATGAQVWRGEGQVGRFLFLPELAEGVYMVRVQAEDFTHMLR